MNKIKTKKKNNQIVDYCKIIQHKYRETQDVVT